MSNIMAVKLNGVAELEYDRDKPLPDYQGAYLDKMDIRMSEGIQLGEEFVTSPDASQRAQFAAANLLHALKTADEPRAAAMCTYLAVRMPDLKQVVIEEGGDGVAIEFVFDEEYRPQVAVDFTLQ